MTQPPPQNEFPEDVAHDDLTEQSGERLNDQAAANINDQGNESNFQGIFDELAEMARAIYNDLHAARQNLPRNVPREEEAVIPDDAMFAIDLPLFPRPRIIVEPLFNHPPLQPVIHHESFGRRALMAPTAPATYDDNEIPRGKSDWLVCPEIHPWVIDGRAYLCILASCNTIVQQRHQPAHDAIIHGIHHHYY